MKTLITRIKRLALALCFVTPLVSWAAEPVAVWDGDFTATQTGYTLNLNGNSLSDDNSVVTIDQESSGIDINFDADMKSTGVTLLVKYSNFVYGEKSKVIATQCNGGTNYSNDRTGVDLQADNTLWGMWYNNGWADNGSKSAAGVFPSSGTYAFTYKNDVGTYLYASSEAFSTPTSVWGASGLKGGTDSLWGVTVGGMRSGTVNTNWRAAQGAKISGIAVFEGVLTMAQVNEYRWPSDASINITENTTVSAINALIANLDPSTPRVFVDVAGGVQIDIDTEFSTTYPIKVCSEGNVTLSAETQPDLSGVAFDVKGALLRPWLTDLVRGFNFTNDSGGNTSGALAEGTWTSVANSASGSSTAMFADGLSTLTWASANTWSAGSGSILSGYLDDGAKNGNGAEVYLTNVPYETYDVIIYCNSDSNPGNFLAKTVNGTTYTWSTASGSVVEGNATWGKAALATPVYGVNALRVKNLSGSLTIYGTPRNGSQRGGIAAIQIMPPETPDNIRTYKLTLNGTATNWSAGTWTLNDQAIEAPTAGYVEIVASASTEVTVDTAVSIASLTIKGGEDVVVSIATDGEEGSSFSTIGATVESGVFKQGVANCVTGLITVDNGATFDMNGLAVGSAINIAGAGAGNWPWALGSSSGEVQLSTPPTLTGDAVIGGAGKIVLGSSGGATAFDLGGFTLTKSGAGELYCYNVRTDNGTIDIAGGTLSFNQWTALDGSETVDRHTTVTVRNGATLNNNAGRRLWIDTLNVEAGATVTTTANGYFGISTAFNGSCDTTKLQFNDGAVVTLDGNLTLATLVAQGDNSHTTVGSISLALADGTSAATVTVSDTVTAVGTIAVGAGVTPAFTGENDVTATLSYAADPSPVANTALAFTQESNWKGTVVFDYAITGASDGSVFQPGKYGNANSTVCLGQGATNVFLSVRGSTNYGNIDTKLYLKGDLSLRNGWGTADKATTIPQLGADEGVTLTTRQGANSSNGTTYYTITALKDFAGTIALSDRTDVTVGNVVLDELPEKGALVVKATTGTSSVKGTISGSVTVGEETVPLVFGTVGEETGLMRPTTVTVIVPAVDNTTVTVKVGDETIGTAAGNYDVAPGSEVTVTYAAADGYQISGTTVYTIDTASATTFDPRETTQVAQIVAQIRTGQTTYEYYTTLAGALASPNVAYGITLRANIDEDEVTVSSYVRITGAYTISSDVKIVDGGQLELTLVTMAGKLTIEENGSYATGGGTLNELVTKDGAKIQLNTLSETAAPLAVTTLSVEGNLTIISTWGSAVRDTYYKAISYVTENADIAEGATVGSVNEWSAKVEAEGDNTVVSLAITKVATVDGVYYDDAQDAVDAAVESGKQVSFLVAPGTVTLGIGETLVVSGATLPTVELDDGLAAPYEVEHTVDAVNVLDIYTVVKYVAKVKNPVYGTTAWQPEVKYTSLADAVAAVIDNNQVGYDAGYVPLVTLLDDVTLTARVEPTKRMIIDLDGKTLTREGSNVGNNGSAFRVTGGNVTIKNGTIDCTQSDADVVANGVYAIDVKGTGASLVLEDMTITVNSQAGACVYPFAGTTVTIRSGTYRNNTAEEYQYKTGWTGMAVNQANVTDKLLTIEGGRFWQVNPEEGDDSGKVTNFLADGRIAKLQEGYWVVQAGTWVAQIEGGAKYETLAAAVADATTDDTVKLLTDVTLDARVEPTKTMVIDLNGKTITREGSNVGNNGSAFRVTGGNVTIKNGTIDCTQSDADVVANGVYAIDVKGTGASLVLEDMTITVNSQAGACVYPFAGTTVTIRSGTYRNNTAEEYQYKTGWTGMAVNQANVTDKLLTIEGGRFWQVNPAEGDDSGLCTSFLASGYESNLVEGYWVVTEKQGIDPASDAGTPVEVDTTKTPEEQAEEANTAAQSLKVTKTTAAAAVDDTAWDGYFTKYAEKDNGGNWVAKAKLNEAVVLAAGKVEEEGEEVSVEEQVFDAVMSSTATAATIPAKPGLYYAIEAANNLGFTGAAAGTPKLAEGATVTLGKPDVSSLTGNAVFYRVKVTVE